METEAGNKPTEHSGTNLLMKHRWAGGKNKKTGSVKQNMRNEEIPFQHKMKYETKTQDHKNLFWHHGVWYNCEYCPQISLLKPGYNPQWEALI